MPPLSWLFYNAVVFTILLDLTLFCDNSRPPWRHIPVGLRKIQFPHISPRAIRKSLLTAKEPSPFLYYSKTGGKEAACESAHNCHLNLIRVLIWETTWEKKGFSPGTQQNCSLIMIPLCLSCAWGAGPLSWLAGTLCPEDANPHSECPKCWRQASGKQKETWGSTCAWECVCFPYQNQLVH